MRNRGAHSPKAFTLIEVMMTLVVLVIGLGALFLTQYANSHAQSSVRDMIYAVNLAELTLNNIRLEGYEWTTNPGQGPGQTKLKRLSAIVGSSVPHVAGGSTSWMLAYNVSGGTDHVFTVGPAGADFSANYSSAPSYDNGIASEFPQGRQQRYCVWYRLVWVIPDYVMRADVQVAWPKKTTFDSNTSYRSCSVSMVSDVNLVNFVTMSTTINRYSSVE